MSQILCCDQSGGIGASICPMQKRPPTGDEPILPTWEGDPAPGLEGVPRADMAELETAVPKLLDLAVRGPVVLTRHGREAYVLMPLDIWRRTWEATPRPPVVPGLPPRK